MANWLDNVTGKAGTVLETIQDVLDVVNGGDNAPAVGTPTTVPAGRTPVAVAPAGGNSDNVLLVGAVVVLAIILLR